MPIAFGPKLGLLYNANINEQYFDQMRPFLQALDQLVNGSVINATTVVPPVSPSSGDAYLISSTPSGAWSTFPVNSIAVWDVEVTNTGTNTRVPAWVNYVPNAGWMVWNVSLSNLYVYSGSAWNPIGAGANFPINTNITQMTGVSTTVGNGIAISSVAVNGNQAIIVTDGTHTSSWSSNGSIVCGQINSSGNISGAAIQASSGFFSNAMGNTTPGTSIAFTLAGTSTYNATFASGIKITAPGFAGSTVFDLDLENFITSSSATGGSASALPAAPVEYATLTFNGNRRKFPLYAV